MSGSNGAVDLPWLEFISTSAGVCPRRSGPPENEVTVYGEYAEEVPPTEPFEARFTCTIGDDALTVTVDDDLSVVDSTRHDSAESV
jgi:hypothetical protein